MASIGDEKRRLPAPKSRLSTVEAIYPIPATGPKLLLRPPRKRGAGLRLRRRLRHREQMAIWRKAKGRAIMMIARPFGLRRDWHPDACTMRKDLTMRNTCALNIAPIPPRVQLLVITNLQPVCVIASARLPGPSGDNDTTSTARTTPPSAIHTGYQATPPYDPQAKASTYASSCSVPPRGPFSGLLTGGK